MVYILSLFLLMTSSSAQLERMTVNADDSFFVRAYETRIDRDDRPHAEQHANAIRPKPERFTYQQQPSLTFTKKSVNIAGQVITRTEAYLDGLLVEGGDGIFNEFGAHKTFSFTMLPESKASFRLNAAEAVEQAMHFHHVHLLKDPYVEKLDDLYDKLWIYHLGELRPAYKIRLPSLTLEDLKDVYIDADTGHVLKMEDSAQFLQAPADVFVYSPSSTLLDKTELKRVMLPNLIDVKEDGFLNGEFISVRTCCKHYTCPENGPCTDDKKRCALESHAGVQQSRELLSLPTATLGLDALISLPEIVHVDTVRCTNLPFARASKKDGNNNIIGFFDTPVDDFSPGAEMDRFSEIQAYYSVMSFFNYIRDVLGDHTWCLRSEAMSCNSDGSTKRDDNGQPSNPYRIFVNQLVPDMKTTEPTQNSPDSFMSQAASGKGSHDKPIVLNELMRYNNAAFVPALSTLKKNPPRADEILSGLIKPFDHNVFYQGDKDFAYDGDVIAHEFMHAVTTSLIGKLNTLGLDKWGINTEPGSLNEAWSDYFTATFVNDPKVGRYTNMKDGNGEISLRNIDNKASCPADVIGENHNDGLVWSGSLWEIRTRLKTALSVDAPVLFDRAVLASLAQAKVSEDFKTQSEKLIANLKLREGLGEPAVAIAEEVFKARGVRDCFRAVTLSSVDDNNKLTTVAKPMLFVASKNQIGLTNYAPAVSQLEIGVPAGAKSMTLTWRQYLGANGALLGTETTPETAKNMVPLSVISNFTTPIVWKFSGVEAHATDGEKAITTPVENSTYKNGSWQYSMPLSFDRCEQKTIYLSLLSNDFKYVLTNLTVNFEMDTSDDRSDCDFSGTMRGSLSEAAVSSCSAHSGTHGWLLAFTLIGLYFYRLRRQNRDDKFDLAKR